MNNFKNQHMNKLAFLLYIGAAISLTSCASPSVHIEDIDISSDSETLAVSLWSSRPDPSSFNDITDVRYWIRLYELDTWHYRDVRIPDRAWSIVFSPDGSLLATGHRNGTINLWDIENGRAEIKLAAHNDTVRSLDFSADNRYLASAGVDGSAKVWVVSSGELLSAMQHDDWVTAVSFSPNGRHLATGSRDGNIRIWDYADGELTTIWMGHIGATRPGAPNPPKGVLDLSYSGDGTLIASGGRDNTLAVWDVGKRELKYRLAEDSRAWTNNVTVVAFSPDDRYVVAGYAENGSPHLAGTVPTGSVFVYESSDGRRVKHLRGLDVRNEGLVFTRDGKTLIAGGGEWPSTASIAVWDVASASLQKRFHPGPMGN